MNIDKLISTSDYGRKYIEPNLKYDALTSWKKKKVLESIPLFDGTNTNYLSSNLKMEKVNDGIMVKATTLKALRKYRETASFSLSLKKLDLTNFNRIKVVLRINAVGHRNFYVHLSICSNGDCNSDAVVVKTNQDEEILYELSHIEKSETSSINLTVFLMGKPSEALPDIEIILKSIRIEKVDLDYDYGWDAPSIAYSQIGYLPNAKKEAIISNTKKDTFKLFDKNNHLVLEKPLIKLNNNLGNFSVADFSEIKEIGEYYLKIGSRETELFDINKDIYLPSIIKSLHFLKALRCGEQIDQVHSECHAHVKCVNSDGRMVNVNGGWHDAGDVSQFEICTAEITTSLLDLIPSFKGNQEMIERIKEEAKVGVNWLLKTTFHDGNRALAILYNVWRDNILDKNDDSVLDNKSENGPFENLLSATALSTAALYYKEDEIYNAWILRTAIEDYHFGIAGFEKGIHTKRWGSNITSVVSAEIVKASIILHQITNEEEYLNNAVKYAEKILECQETIGIGKDKIRGFFYEDEDHKYILSYEHRGHEQNPIQALSLLIKYFNKNKITTNRTDYMFWIDAVKLYKEYAMKTIEYTKPYKLVPNNIYNLDKINWERFTIYPNEMEEAKKEIIDSIKEGIKIDDNWYLRIFPASYSRRGFLATHLSKIKALSSIYTVDKDPKLKQIIVDQLEWMFGKNPFSVSFMYGEGHKYHPLYVAFSNQIVGALPVGVKTQGTKDIPYWPQETQAVFKEIWGHTTSKYLWILGDIL